MKFCNGIYTAFLTNLLKNTPKITFYYTLLFAPCQGQRSCVLWVKNRKYSSCFANKQYFTLGQRRWGAGELAGKILAPKTAFLAGENSREKMIFSFLYLFTFVNWRPKSIHIFLLNAHKLVSTGYLCSFQTCMFTCISKLSSQRCCWLWFIRVVLLIFPSQTSVVLPLPDYNVIDLLVV